MEQQLMTSIEKTLEHIDNVRRAVKHDIGNSIAMVLRHVSLAESASEVPENILQQLDSILRSADDANRLMGELSAELCKLVICQRSGSNLSHPDR